MLNWVYEIFHVSESIEINKQNWIILPVDGWEFTPRTTAEINATQNIRSANILSNFFN